MLSSFLEGTVGSKKADFCVTLVGVKKINTTVVGSPLRTLNVAVELVGNRMGARAVAVHHVELSGLVALIAVVKAGIGDPFSVGRNNGRVVRSLAIGQSAKGAVGHAELVDLGIEIFVIGFGMPIDGNNQILAIRCPGRAGRAEFVAAVGEIAVGDLARGTALAVYDEELHVPGFEIARPIETIDQSIIGGGRIGPFCAGGRGRKIGEVRTFS